MSSKRNRKNAFTLLEITLAMLILTLIGTGIGWHIRSMISSHTLESEATALCITLQEAQLLAITHQTDFSLQLYPHQGKLCYRLLTDEPLQIDRKEKPLRGIRSFSWRGKKEPKLTLRLFSTGRIEPTGLLGLISQEDKQEALWIDLQTPLQIRLFHQRPTPSVAGHFPALPKETER